MSGVPVSLTEQIAQHLMRPIAPSVRAKARLHLLDWIGCVAGARRSPVGRIQSGMAGVRAVDKAAWLGNVLEMDDVHRTAILHPGPVIWPTALGGAGVSLDHALDAGVRGYEAMIAVGTMLDGRHYGYWHNTATAGLFGAAATAAACADATAGQLTDAMGLAGSVAGGFWQMRHEPVMAKQWHLAHAMNTGQAAARQAMHGITGPRFILEGPQGLFAATCAAPGVLDLREHWCIGEVSFKPWGACRHAHPAIDAALVLKAQGALHGTITVETYRDALTFCDRPAPATVTEAKFSIQHALAVVMMRGVPQLADFEPEAIAALADVCTLIQVIEEPALTAAYPAHFGARVSSAAGSVTLADAFGDPERPMSRDDVIGKSRALMSWGGLDPQAIDQAIGIVLEGDRTRDVLALLEQWL